MSDMIDPMVARIEANPKYHELKRKRSSFGWLLTILMLLVYYGYVGFALGADGVLDATASDIDGTGVLAGFVAWRHVFDPKLRGNLMVSRAQFDNDTDWTGFGVTKSAQSIHANLIYSPFPKLDIGAELIFGNRELESGADGDLRRLHTSVKYSF